MKIYVVLYGEDDEIYGVLKAFGDSDKAKAYAEYYDNKNKDVVGMAHHKACIVTTELEDNADEGKG